MLNFFKDSWRELKHVVWPTRGETRKYFVTVMVVLICFWLYLFIASTIFSEILFGIKWALSGTSTSHVSPIFDPNSIVVNSWSLESTGSIVETGSVAQ
jgi:preprotein translocase SecE subunit